MIIYYFTATGNSLYVAKKIQEKIGDAELISIPKVIKNEELEVDSNVIGFIYPIHCGSLPIVVEEFISKIKIKNNTYIFALAVTGGGGAETSFYHINKLLIGKGELSNYGCIKYISNYTRAGRNPTEERAIKAIEDNSERLYGFIESVQKREKKKVNNKRPIGFIGYKMWKDYYKTKDKGFNVNNDCIGCNMCRQICPVDNIEMIDEKPIWLGKCTDCMACINICPKKAINIGKKTIKKNRYRNPYINVKELL